MLEASDEVMRHKVMKGRAVSTRFKVRAMSDSMPTMKHEGDKVQEGNAYHYMYEAHIEGGKCTCGSGEQETMQHIYGECKHTEAVRVAGVQKVKTSHDGLMQVATKSHLCCIPDHTLLVFSMQLLLHFLSVCTN